MVTGTGLRKYDDDHHGGLVLARRIGERILIDGGIEVKVVGIRGGIVKLHFVAPRTTSIMREELLDDGGRAA